MNGWSRSPRMPTALPSSTVSSQTQVSGQSSGQAPRCVVRAMTGMVPGAGDGRRAAAAAAAASAPACAPCTAPARRCRTPAPSSPSDPPPRIAPTRATARDARGGGVAGTIEIVSGNQRVVAQLLDREAPNVARGSPITCRARASRCTPSSPARS